MISADSAVVAVVRGNTAILRCTATGEPVPLQTWTRNGLTVSESGSRFQTSENGRVLTISAVREEDGGVYMCHASSTAGRDSATVTVDVQGECSRILQCDSAGHVTLLMQFHLRQRPHPPL